MIISIKNICDDHCIASSSKHNINLISQIKIYALILIVENSIKQRNRPISSEVT